jgi:putative DNA primase/helicase
MKIDPVPGEGSVFDSRLVELSHLKPPRHEPKPDDDAFDKTPCIRIAAGEVAFVADQAERALTAAGLPIFTRGGHLVSPVVETAKAAQNRKTTIVRLKRLAPERIIDLLSRHADFEKFDKRSNKWIAADPPEMVARIILARDSGGKFPAVTGAITTPTLRHDGSILDTPGYDAETGLYLELDPGVKMPPMPAAPTRADALRALAILKDLISGFPFVTEVDRAVALSGFMMAVLRGAMLTAPLHVFRAHTAGTGKSLLVDTAAAIATGRWCPVIGAGKTEEEREKRLGALLLGGVAIVSIDNVNGELGGDALAQMTERPLVQPRILGKSEMPEIECKSAVFATGNNLTIVGDTVRRCLISTQDAGVERPELRTFNFNPVDRVLQNRGVYIAACLTIARAARAARVKPPSPPLGSYADWCELVRAPLVWLGEADPVESRETAREEAPNLTAIRELFACVRKCFRQEQWTAQKLITTASLREYADGPLTEPELNDLLQRQAGEGGRISSRKLGLGHDRRRPPRDAAQLDCLPWRARPRFEHEPRERHSRPPPA